MKKIKVVPSGAKKQRINEKHKHEWIMREYGSYEDSGGDLNHVVAILNRSPKGFVAAISEQEATAIRKSAGYVSIGYDDDHQLAASEAISKFINF